MHIFVQQLMVSSNFYVFVDKYGDVIIQKMEYDVFGIRFCNLPFFAQKKWDGGPPLTTRLDMR